MHRFFLIQKVFLKSSAAQKVLIGVSLHQRVKKKKPEGSHRHGYLLDLALIIAIIMAFNFFTSESSAANCERDLQLS